MFILNTKPKVILITLKFNSTGEVNPKDSPYPSHHKKSTFDANSPSNPPITIQHNTNKTNIHIFFSLVAIPFSPSFENILKIISILPC